MEISSLFVEAWLSLKAAREFASPKGVIVARCFGQANYFFSSRRENKKPEEE